MHCVSLSPCIGKCLPTNSLPALCQAPSPIASPRESPLSFYGDPWFCAEVHSPHCTAYVLLAMLFSDRLAALNVVIVCSSSGPVQPLHA